MSYTEKALKKIGGGIRKGIEHAKHYMSEEEREKRTRKEIKRLRLKADLERQKARVAKYKSQKPPFQIGGGWQPYEPHKKKSKR